jgi:hypothetical protein
LLGHAPDPGGTHATSLEFIFAGNLLAVDRQVTTLNDREVSDANKDEKILERQWQIDAVSVVTVAAFP